MIGWMSKGMLDLAASLIAEKAISTALKAELAAERARVDWFMQHVNELKVERSALYQRIGVFLPVPTIERVGPVGPIPPLPGMDDGYVPPTGAQPPDLGNVMATARELRDSVARRGAEPVDIPFQGFEDIGDEAATAIGAKHQPDGTVVFTR